LTGCCECGDEPSGSDATELVSEQSAQQSGWTKEKGSEQLNILQNKKLHDITGQ
jgi:hypothetical protein